MANKPGLPRNGPKLPAAHMADATAFMLLPFLHHDKRIDTLIADTKTAGQVDCDWVMVGRPSGKDAIDVEELEKYIMEVTDAEVVEVASKEERGCT